MKMKICEVNMVRIFVALFLGAILSSPSVYAENRFSLAETENGTVRLDRETGEVSFCRPISGGIACTLAADEREALLRNNEELSDRLEALEKRMEILEEIVGGSSAKKNDTLSKNDEEGSSLKKNAQREFDNAMKVTENVMRRFIDMMKNLKQDLEAN